MFRSDFRSRIPHSRLQKKCSLPVIMMSILRAQTSSNMPKVKTKKTKFPDGWEELEPYLDELDKEMRMGACSFAATVAH